MLEQYTYPDEVTTIEDSLEDFRIFYYVNADTNEMYDFVAEIMLLVVKVR